MSEEDFVEYEDMTVVELKAEADGRTPPVPYKSGDNKAVIIAALEKWDDEQDDSPDVEMAETQTEDAPPDEPPAPEPEPGPKPATFTYTLRPKSLAYVGDTSWETANWKACTTAAMNAGYNPVGDPRRVDVTQFPPEVTYEVDVA